MNEVWIYIWIFNIFLVVLLCPVWFIVHNLYLFQVCRFSLWQLKTMRNKEQSGRVGVWLETMGGAGHQRVLEAGRGLLRSCNPLRLLKLILLEQVAQDCVQLSFEWTPQRLWATGSSVWPLMPSWIISSTTVNAEIAQLCSYILSLIDVEENHSHLLEPFAYLFGRLRNSGYCFTPR